MSIALFHFHVTQIKRSAGQSAVAAAAYRAGEKLHSAYYGAGKMSKARQQNTDKQNYQHMERYYFRVLLDYYRLLCRWKEDYAPQTPEDGYHPRFVEALQKLPLVEYLLDELLCGDIQARASVVIEYGEEVRKIEQRMAELAAADEAAAQNAGGQHGTAEER